MHSIKNISERNKIDTQSKLKHILGERGLLVRVIII
jgi:hypothetical protein